MPVLKKLPAAFYATSGGNEPVRAWLKGLGERNRKAVGHDIATAEYGWPIGMPICQSTISIWQKQTQGDSVMSGKKGRIGSSFESYLEEEGACSETYSLAIKRVLAWQLQQAMEQESMSKNQMAKAMHTSRSQLDRVLDPENERIQLDTMIKAARALGKELRVELV